MESWSASEITFIVKEYDYSEPGYIQLSSREGANTDSDKPHLIFYYDEEIDDINIIVPIVMIAGLGITICIVIILVKKSKPRNIPKDVKTKIPSPYAFSNTFCSNCGTKIQVGEFCTNCGKKQA